MEITITGGAQSQLSQHFNESEFYSHSSDRPASHPFYTELVEAAEYLRTHFGVPWRITSTFRTEKEETYLCAKMGKKLFLSQHMVGRAFDSQPASTPEKNREIMLALAADFVANGPIYQQLRRLGINGLGLYPTFIHLDNRTDKTPQRDAFGRVSCWDNRPASIETRFAAKKKAVAPPMPTNSTKPRLVAVPRRGAGASSLSCSR